MTLLLLVSLDKNDVVLKHIAMRRAGPLSGRWFVRPVCPLWPWATAALERWETVKEHD